MQAKAQTHTPPLNLFALGFSSRAQAALEMAVASRGAAHYTFVSEIPATQITIVDLDGADAKKLLADFRQRFDGPVVALSVRDPELRDITWIAKPVKVSTLLAALADLEGQLSLPPVAKPPAARIVELPDTRTPAAEPTAIAPPPASEPAKARVPRVPKVADAQDTAHAAGLARTERRWHPSYGKMSEAAYTDPDARTQLFYDPADYFQSALQRAIEQATSNNRPLRIKLEGSGNSVNVFPELNRVQTNLRENLLRSLAMIKGSGKDSTIEALPDDAEPVIDFTDPRLESTTGLLWKAALWAAMGRVPVGTELELPVTLKAWPNFTRIFIPHHAIQIAALWSQRPATLHETATILGIEHRYVFSFYSATAVLGLVEQIHGSKRSAATQQRAEQRGFLGRLLNFLGAGN
ncbi:MAG: hypothetical protein KDJ27_05805 [Gammaproteobacteria bacterium]|nr:hypothetical protein [Gammaproteobacteria bacterium]